MPRHSKFAPLKRCSRYLSSIALAGVLVCAGLFANAAPALADAFSHLPTIDVYPTVSWATGNDEYGSPGGPDPANNIGLNSNNAGTARSGVIDFNAVISVPLLKGLAFQYEHDRAAGIDTTIGRVTGSTVNAQGHNIATNTYIYPASNNDIVDTFRLSYSGIKGVGVTLGSFYRFRHDNTATDDPLNGAPADWHEQFLNVGYTAPPIASLNGLTLGAYIDGEYNHHHVSGNPNISPFATANIGTGLAGAAAEGYSDYDGKPRFGVNWGFNGNLPINHHFAIFGSWSKGAFDFFDNNPLPFYYIIDDVGISKSFNKTLSLTADTNNLTQYNLGGDPFVPPNTIHRVYFDIALDIHLAP